MTTIYCDFKLCYLGNLVIVIDLDLGNRSVTNDIENVIKLIAGRSNMKGMRLIYRDSEKHYSEIVYDGSSETNKFRSIGITSDLMDVLIQFYDSTSPELTIYTFNKT